LAPLVLLHGFTGAAQSWDEVVELLGYPGRVLAPDLPGHGRSWLGEDATHYTMESAATALDAALHVLGVSQPSLVGYSMGGRLALYYAITRARQISRLVLESASPGVADEDERKRRMLADDELARHALADGIERFVDRWELTPVLASQRGLAPERRERLRTLRVANDVRGLAQSLLGMGSGAQPYLGARLGEVRAGTLVVAGAEDEKFSAIARTLAAGISDAAIRILPNVGHTPHLENPKGWVDVVGGFINDGRAAA
jgi:2-succinyl-6-hydroxy-2,4-cyclohexadiene-1-carboxylate synthase